MESQKSKFARRAMDIIDQNPAVFKALEDFEKTGRLVIKTRLNFTIDREMARKFRSYCKRHNLNMSEIIEDFIRKKYLNKD